MTAAVATFVDIVGALARNPTGNTLKCDLRRPYRESRDRQVG